MGNQDYPHAETIADRAGSRAARDALGEERDRVRTSEPAGSGQRHP